jgi:hypothetical protein
VPTGTADAGTIERVLQGALRAPSAHNAQPWRLSRVGPRRFSVWYAYADKLRADPDDRDGIMAVGGFYETLRLTAHAAGLQAAFEPDVARHADGITLGEIAFARLTDPPDSLATAIADRHCNRHKYARTPLPAGLARELEAMGNVLLDPDHVAPLVARASVLSWKDRRFVSDLAEWTRFEPRAPDGMTFDCLRVDRFDAVALRLALRMGRLPSWLARLYAERDVRFTRASGAMAVLTTSGRDPLDLFECGRRLIRGWTLINSLGYAWHPMSVVIDQATVDTLRTMIDGRDPIAIYRVGRPDRAAARSQRRSLDAILVPPPA